MWAISWLISLNSQRGAEAYNYSSIKVLSIVPPCSQLLCVFLLQKRGGSRRDRTRQLVSTVQSVCGVCLLHVCFHVNVHVKDSYTCTV